MTQACFSLLVYLTGLKEILSPEIYFSTNNKCPLVLPITIPLLKHFNKFGTILSSVNISVKCCLIINFCILKLKF